MDYSLQPFLLMLLSNKNNDTLYNNFLLIIILFLFQYANKVIPFEKISDKILDFFQNKKNFISINIPSNEIPVVKSFSNIHSMKTIYSKTFLSIIYFLMKNKNCKIETLTEILVNSSELNFYFDEKKKINEYIFIPLDNEKIVISSNSDGIEIFFEIQLVKKDENEEEKKKTVQPNKNFMIILSIKKNFKNNIDILIDFMKKCNDLYDLEMNENRKNDQYQYIFEYKNFEKTETSFNLIFDEFIMEHNKDLNSNIFFEEKDKLIKYITPFIYDPMIKINDGEERYKKCGFTFKAGLLFYGNPGCGKTSTIKAILSYTKRHGIIINLNKIKTCEELKNVFRKRVINDRELVGKQLCYILEDCDAFENNFLNTRNKNEEKISTDLLQMAKIVENSSLLKNNNNEDDDKVNLSCFLNLLDGIIELHGIMIIMTTNHPEKIDNALLRHGRFDFKYEFKKASKKIIQEMLMFQYNLSKENVETYIQNANIVNELLSPAEIQCICFKNDNIQDCILDIEYRCKEIQSTE